MKLKAVYIIAVTGLVCAVAAAIFFFLGCSWTDAIGAIATVISIVLGVVSIVYTYVSGKETMHVLNEIRKENLKLVEKINYELSKSNFNEENINNIRKSIK